MGKTGLAFTMQMWLQPWILLGGLFYLCFQNWNNVIFLTLIAKIIVTHFSLKLLGYGKKKTALFSASTSSWKLST